MTSRIREILVRGAGQAGIEFEQSQLDQFILLAEELDKWNRKMNLTALISEEDVALKHFLDSIMLKNYVALEGRLLDIGSGGGFPAIPLKIVRPELKVVSVDAVGKKINFQKHMARKLNFTDFTAIQVRAEVLVEQYANTFDLIVSRAFSDLVSFVSLALPLLGPQGKIVAMKGREGRVEAQSSAEDLKRIGAVLGLTHEFQLPLTEEVRTLVVVEKKAKNTSPAPGEREGA